MTPADEGSARRLTKWREELPIACALGLLALLPYLIGGVSGSFTNFDDPEYVSRNRWVTGGLTAAGIRWALTAFHSANWHPLTWISHMLDVSLFGMDARWHHLTSILLHCLTAALVYLGLSRMTGARWPSALAVALFAVHPLRVESVAWAAERKDVLAGLLFALLLLTYTNFVRRRGGARYGLVVALFALGLMAKPMLVTVPFLLLLLDVWPLGRAGIPLSPRQARAGTTSWPQLLIEKAPLFVLSVTSIWITLAAQSASRAVAPLGAFPLGARFANSLVHYARYLGMSLWPSALSLHYPFPASGYSAWQILGAATLVGALMIVAVVQFGRRPYLAIGWLWFVGTIVPVVGIVQLADLSVADRYTYLPHLGLFLLVSWGVAELASARPGLVGALWLGSAAILVPLVLLAAVRAREWRDPETLYQQSLARTPGDWKLLMNLGALLEGQNRLEEALACYRAALRTAPEYGGLYTNLGTVLSKLDRRDEALRAFDEALRKGANRARTLTKLGGVLFDSDRADQAIPLFAEALTLDPESTGALGGYGDALASLGRYDEAVIQYEKALALDPSLSASRLNLGNSLAALGRLEQAQREYETLLRLQPGSFEARLNLANLLVRVARPAAAVPLYREALRIRPGDPHVRANLRSTLGRLGLAEQDDVEESGPR
ncbi:MAG TPA: tetratricopeptide repeat protein [Candidatus Methanoperedens sp.]|nr:tetratricopeptide repeat protein [Candidatus Methanoperedens sp.]